jgi:DNA-binding NtrC family response regulator
MSELTKPTILVVDDEAEVRKLVGAMLTRDGYDVLVSDSGDQAIKTFRKHGSKIQLLLTDVVSPGMSGPMLADALLEVQPDLHVLFMSGFDNTQVVQHYVVERGFSLLIKPFTMDQLRDKVREALGRDTTHGSATA